MSVGWFTSPSLDQQFTWCDKIGKGHPDPDIAYAEGQFYLVTQQRTDYVSPGPWVEKVSARVGVDTDNDGKIDKWSDWGELKESYDYTPGFSKQIAKVPARLNLSELPDGYGFQIEFNVEDTTENKSKPIVEKMTLLFEPFPVVCAPDSTTSDLMMRFKESAFRETGSRVRGSIYHGLISFLVGATMVHGQESLPPLEGQGAPQTFEALVSGFNPRAEPLDVEILKEWEEDGVVMKVLRYRVGVFKGKKSMMAAIFGYPKGAVDLPGLVQIHGGGQYADHKGGPQQRQTWLCYYLDRLGREDQRAWIPGRSRPGEVVLGGCQRGSRLQGDD